MGFLESLSAVGDWVQNRWTTDWAEFRDTYKTAWKEQFPKAWSDFWSGSVSLASVWQGHPGNFLHGARLWMDGALGLGSSALAGTIGGLFAMPVANETTALLNHAYRYGVARPIAWQYVAGGQAMLAAGDARQRGEDPQVAYLKTMLSWENWRTAFNATEYVTPGQAMAWGAGSIVGATRPGNPDDPLNWSREHDPRSISGNAKYNSDESEFLLKYASGGVDTFLTIAGDPAFAGAKLSGLAKARYFDKLATEKYIKAGGHEREVTTKRYEKFYETAVKSKTPEALRWRTTLATTRFGGSVAPVLWAAAKMNKDVFRDVYVIARGMDGLRGAGMGAWDRLLVNAPAMHSDLARIFANFNIGEDALGTLRGQQSGDALHALMTSDVDAFVAGIVNREGVWGTLPGKLQMEGQPRANWASAVRSGVHTFAMTIAPVHVGRPLAKVLQAFLPSQGFTPFLDAEDATDLSLRQLKANLERSGLPPDEVDFWASQWSAKGSREGRNQVYERAEDKAIAVVAERLGVPTQVVIDAIPEINRYRHGARRIVSKQRVYLADQAALAGARNVAEGRATDAAGVKNVDKARKKLDLEGQYGTAYIPMPNVDGHLNVIEVSDTGKLPNLAADPKRPALLSQTEQMIPTIDFRALEGQLKWWMRAHADDFVRDLESGQIIPRRLAGPEFKEDVPVSGMTQGYGGPRWPSDRRWEELPTSPASWALSKLARLHSAWEMAITSADFANMVWKSSALLRPAQTPRNLADDVLRRLLIFGKAHLIVSSMRGSKRVVQNVRARTKLRHELNGELTAQRRASRTATAEVNGVVDGAAVSVKRVDETARGLIAAANERIIEGLGKSRRKPKLAPDAVYYEDVGEAWKAGLISLDTYVEALDWMSGSGLDRRVPGPLFTAITARDQAVYHVDPGFSNRRMTEVAPTKKPFHDRALKRRIIEYHFQDRMTDWLDDLRLDAVHRRTGLPMDPRQSLVDQRLVWLRDLVRRHIGARRTTTGGAGAAARDYRPGQVVINPFTGEIPDGWDSLEDFTLRHHMDLEIKAVTDEDGTQIAKLGEPSERMAEFITDNVDDLMRPDHLLYMSVTPTGGIRIGVAQVKPEAAAKKGPVKRGAAYRLRNFKFHEIADAGHDKVKIRVNSPVGEIDEANPYAGSVDHIIEMRGAREGVEGQSFQLRAAASEGQGSAMYLTGEANLSRILDNQGGWGIAKPEDKHYATSWERAVNAQIAGDPVARKFLEGKTDSDVINWIESTSEGTKYIHRMHYFGVNYVDHVRQIEAMVNSYAPDGHTKAGKALRDKILDKSATRQDLDRVRQRSEQPEVHGASTDYIMGRGAIFNTVTRGIDRLQRWLADIPTDKASRFPFFDEAYRRHITDLVRTADYHAFVADDVIPTRLLQNLERQARDRALYDTKYYLYDVAQLNDLARFFRYVVPFSSAMMDAYIKYGRIIRNNPGVVLQGLYYWELFENQGNVQDEEGHVLVKDTGGAEHWYSVDPDTGQRTEVPVEDVGTQRYVQFRFPSDFLPTNKLYGVDIKPSFALNKQTLQVFLGLPNTGPFVAIPANEFALHHPEFAENKMIKQFVLPFGPSVDRKRVALPGNVRSALDQFNLEDGNTAEGQAKAIYQAELIAWNRGERDSAPTFKEVRERAAALRAVRFLATWISPVSFQPKSPYAPYIDAYRQLKAQVPEQADEQFQARHGDEFYALAMTVTRNNAGIRATIEDNKKYLKFKELITAYPELAGLIVGSNGGTFSKAVYEAQKTIPLRPGAQQKLREVMSLEESVEAVERNRVWDQYSKLQDLIDAELAERGLSTMRGAQAEDLQKMRDAFVDNNKYWKDPETGRDVVSPWYKDFSSVDHAQMDNRIEAMWAVVQDPDLQKRDDIRGLIDYLHMRQAMQEDMAQQGVRTLDAYRARQLLDDWHTQVFALRERNTEFAPVWTRWLANDDKLQLPKAVTNG